MEDYFRKRLIVFHHAVKLLSILTANLNFDLRVELNWPMKLDYN